MVRTNRDAVAVVRCTNRNGTAPQEPGVDAEEAAAVIMPVAILQTAKSVIILT